MYFDAKFLQKHGRGSWWYYKILCGKLHLALRQKVIILHKIPKTAQGIYLIVDSNGYKKLSSKCLLPLPYEEKINISWKYNYLKKMKIRILKFFLKNLCHRMDYLRFSSSLFFIYLFMNVCLYFPNIRQFFPLHFFPSYRRASLVLKTLFIIDFP